MNRKESRPAADGAKSRREPPRRSAVRGKEGNKAAAPARWRQPQSDEARGKRTRRAEGAPRQRTSQREEPLRQHRASQRGMASQRPQRGIRKAEAAKSGSTAKTKHPEGAMRLNKYIAHAGICSRREADELIAAGSVKVNGQVVTEMGYQVLPGDQVSYGGETLRSERPRYFLLNKPKGFITTTDDPQERRTVMMLMDGCCPERIYPVGRLDRATTGLLLFTNDGALARKLTHPSTQVYKIYQVELDKPVTKEDMKRMMEGVELDDGPMKVDDVQYAAVGKAVDRRVVGVELHSGRNRIVRRLFEALGYEVHKLDRVVFAGLTKKDLPRGRWRELSEKEVGFLKMI